jgi:hypothetical protein
MTPGRSSGEPTLIRGVADRPISAEPYLGAVRTFIAAQDPQRLGDARNPWVLAVALCDDQFALRRHVGAVGEWLHANLAETGSCRWESTPEHTLETLRIRFAGNRDLDPAPSRQRPTLVRAGDIADGGEPEVNLLALEALVAESDTRSPLGDHHQADLIDRFVDRCAARYVDVVGMQLLPTEIPAVTLGAEALFLVLAHVPERGPRPDKDPRRPQLDYARGRGLAFLPVADRLVELWGLSRNAALDLALLAVGSPTLDGAVYGSSSLAIAAIRPDLPVTDAAARKWAQLIARSRAGGRPLGGAARKAVERRVNNHRAARAACAGLKAVS